MTSIMTRSILFILLKARRLKSHRNKNKLPSFDDFPFLRCRKTVKHIRSSKIFFIMRGLPGSGKSTLARAIRLRFKEAVMCSADSFFVQKDGSYAYDFEKLPQAHEASAQLAQQAAEAGVRHIVVDNTNVVHWEMRKYLKLASEYGYAVIVVEPKTPWKLEPVELAARNTHGCTVEVVEKKMKKFKAVLPVYWGWFFDETVASELLMLVETYFDMCMRTVPEFATYMNELGVSKGLTLPLSFKEFYNRPKGLLHCTSFFSGSKSRQSPGVGEYADRLEVQHSMGKAFSLKLVGIMFSPRTVGIRIVLDRLQLSLWGAEDVWFPQPPPKPKSEDVAQSTDGSEVLTQDATKVQKQKKDRKRSSDISKVLKRDKNVKKSDGICSADDLDISLSDVNFDFQEHMSPDENFTELAIDRTDIRSTQNQNGYKMSPFPGSIETAAYDDGIKIKPYQSGIAIIPDGSASEVSSVLTCSENGAEMALDKGINTMTLGARSAKIKETRKIPETCHFVVEDGMLDLGMEGNLPCCSCSENGSSCQKHSGISADKCCPLMPSTSREELSVISAEDLCQTTLGHEDYKPTVPVDKFSPLPTDSATQRDQLDQQHLTRKKIIGVNLADFPLNNDNCECTQNFSQSDIFSHQPLQNNTSILLENSTNCSALGICPEPARQEDSKSIEGNSDDVPRIQLQLGSRAHITLGCVEGYAAVQTGFDQMEILLCEDNEVMVGESVVIDGVEISYYGEGKCAVYFDWPIYKSALFTGKY